MRKLLLKLVPAVLGLMMMSSITAFAEVKPDAKAVYDELEAKSAAMDDAHMFAHIYMVMLTDKERMDMALNMNMLYQNMTQPDQMQFISQMKMLVENQPLDTLVWYKDGYSYTDMMGQKIKVKNDMATAMKSAMGITNTLGSSSNLFSDLTLTTDGQNRVLNYKMDDAKMKDYLQTVMNTAGLGDVFSAAGMQMTFRDMKGTYTLTPDNLYSTATVTMAIDLTTNGETLTVIVAGNMRLADPGQPVEFTLPDPAGYEELPATAA